MREQEFLASLHQLKAIENGGFMETLEEKGERGFWLTDPTNGFTHWIVYEQTEASFPEWDDEQEF